ncbi:Rubredoxin-NAD(+) reductase [Diplonema papillatum]|nr:Rubredoxin-NAD(+) reductase [Diplonema papillatum]
MKNDGAAVSPAGLLQAVGHRLRVEAEVLLLRLRWCLLRCSGDWWGTQQSLQFVISLEKSRRLQKSLTHIDVGVRPTPSTYAARPPPASEQRHLVLVGGGHTHAYTLKNLITDPDPAVHVTLVTRSTRTPYSGMLPGYIAGIYTYEECHVNLSRLCELGGYTLVVKEVVAFDLARKLVKAVSPGTADAPVDIPFDVLSIDIGSTPRSEISGAAVVPVKPIDSLHLRWEDILRTAERRLSTGQPFRVAIIGAGASGCEMALNVEARLAALAERVAPAGTGSAVELLSRGKEVLGSHSPAAKAEVMAELRRRRIRVHLDADVVSFSEAASVLVTAGGEQVPCDAALSCAAAGTAAWLTRTGLALDAGGFIAVNGTLRSTSHADVFAAGDCAGLPKPVSKAGVIAVREGPVLTRNLRRALRGDPDYEVFVPPSVFLGLISTGHTSTCIASRGPAAFTAPWLWDLKHWIDCSWMAEYNL